MKALIIAADQGKRQPHLGQKLCLDLVLFRTCHNNDWDYYMPERVIEFPYYKWSVDTL